jgi:biopolymer transport protein ExbB
LPSHSAVPLSPIVDEAQSSGWQPLLSTAQERLASLVDAGGPVVIVLLLLSTVALAVILLKWWQFFHLRIESRTATDRALTHWRKADPAAAMQAVAGLRQPSAQLVLLALQGASRPGTAMAELREELTRVASRHLESLRAHLRTLEVIGTLSPLLGLLGTVIGMIEAFRQLESAGSMVDPAVLSGGIWQALLTTALGLSVAIPVVLAHSWLERKVERCRHTMEDAVTQVFTRDLQPAAAHPQATDPERATCDAA